MTGRPGFGEEEMNDSRSRHTEAERDKLFAEIDRRAALRRKVEPLRKYMPPDLSDDALAIAMDQLKAEGRLTEDGEFILYAKETE